MNQSNFPSPVLVPTIPPYASALVAALNESLSDLERHRHVCDAMLQALTFLPWDLAAALSHVGRAIDFLNRLHHPDQETRHIAELLQRRIDEVVSSEGYRAAA